MAADGELVFSTHAEIAAKPLSVSVQTFENLFYSIFSFENVYSHPAGPSRARKRLGLLKMYLLKAVSGYLVHIEENYALPEWHVGFFKR